MKKTEAEFEKVLEEALELYVIRQNEASKKLDEKDDVPFSKEHQRKMQEIFKMVREKR